MPSISDLDQSLTLPQFPRADAGTMPSVGELDQSLTLPQFPRADAGGEGAGTMPAISELELSISLPEFPPGTWQHLTSMSEVWYAQLSHKNIWTLHSFYSVSSMLWTLGTSYFCRQLRGSKICTI